MSARSVSQRSTSRMPAQAKASLRRCRAWLCTLLAMSLGTFALDAAAVVAPVFRFFNTQTGTHFYTISASERDGVLAKYPQFTYEGPVFWAYTDAQSGAAAVYRFFNTQTGTHFYTTSAAERDNVIAKYPQFTFEGAVYWVPQGKAADRTDLYRFFNTQTGTHFYTTSAAERDNVIAKYPQFVYEGAVYVVFGAAAPATAAVASTADAWRLLDEATFGASQAESARLLGMGIAPWIEDQFAQPQSGYPDAKYNVLQLKQTVDCGTTDASGKAYAANAPQFICYRDDLTPTGMARDFFTNAVAQPDQLRQRVAWALSQIHVVSTTENDLFVAYPMARYQNILFDEAFGNFESLLKRVTLSPAMGNYLDMVNNDKPNAATGRVPNENYAREIMQLFSIGLVQLNPDGTSQLDASGQAIPTYGQDEIKQFARVFTGWTYPNVDGSAALRKNPAYYATPMVVYPNGHDTDVKTLLNGLVLPANQSAQADLDAAIHNIFMHPNVGPFIGKQLIQRLVTGNPSPAYVQRVATAFADNGKGIRGDMKAVLRAILLDPEARGDVKTDPTFGSLREPVLMVTGMLRALNGVTDGNNLANSTAVLGQRPYSSPTVFNFFPPDYTIPGTDILAPEFGIHNSNTAVARANLVFTLIYSGLAVDATVPNATGTRIPTTAFEAVADQPGTLVDNVAYALLGAPLTGGARDAVVSAVNAVAVTDRTGRARMALYLVASSYEFQVQR
jgi:uncharacterized protein (DUF1800 family)